jgi:uncharacterized RDD family membrane protein YckC
MTTQSDELFQIDTPENVAFDYVVAGIGSRFLAALVDTILLLVLYFLAALFPWLVMIAFGLDLESGVWVIAIFGMLAFLFFIGYYVVFELVWNGQSPGKRWVGLRVVRMDGTPVTLTESLIRNLVRLVDLMPTAYGVGVVTMFINPQARRLGDLAAGTLVVHDHGGVTIQSLEAYPVGQKQAQAGSEANALPVERLSGQDVQMAEDFLARRQYLPNAPVLMFQILNALLRRMDIPSEPLTYEQAVHKLENIVQAARARKG